MTSKAVQQRSPARNFSLELEAFPLFLQVNVAEGAPERLAVVHAEKQSERLPPTRETHTTEPLRDQATTTTELAHIGGTTYWKFSAISSEPLQTIRTQSVPFLPAKFVLAATLDHHRKGVIALRTKPTFAGRILCFVLCLPTNCHAYREVCMLQDMAGAPPVLRLYPTRRRRPGGVDLHPAERSPGRQSCPQRDWSPLDHKLLQVCGKVERRSSPGHSWARDRGRGEHFTRKPPRLNVRVFDATLKPLNFRGSCVFGFC